jgi:hypothetical protein
LIRLSLYAASDLDVIGVSLLRQFDPSLTGMGIKVALVEASEGGSPPGFEVNPSAVGQPTSLFTFISSVGSSSSFPNSVGVASGHANSVAAVFFGTNAGVAPRISHVNNYEANHYYGAIVASLSGSERSTRIVNQSFVFDQDSEVEQNYDDYAARYNILFVSGAAQNFMRVLPAASSFNGLGVGVSDDANPPFGPTLDGRSKPDITAPGTVASLSTPYVAGSAALLLQAALRGDAGPNTISSATNILTLKALLLNGAVKPPGWTNSSFAPLDGRKGAGVVNVFNSWTQLKSGRHARIEMTSVPTNTSHPPGGSLSNVSSLTGWDYRAITNSMSTDKIHHYYFNLPDISPHTLTATLVWNRQENKTAINDLNLFLYQASTSNLVAASTSSVDNVEHLWVPQLAPGRYDLQVLKRGTKNQVSAREIYALAFEMFNLPLQISLTNNDNIAITWPAVPAGFRLYSTPTVLPSSWTPVNAAVSVNTNAAHSFVILPVANSNRFFRLQRP